ncbi:metallophosphoesterase [Histidinibacterium aquaticum]|uniref:Serine/threonine protein phosphatase n=1 Tax=Histidinibacterium aquaticum TaxID=2613962 RepID=A0A5J5GLS6_9RHOB|nr:metallophosphoesterase [Histidinibacterium aquaticum]KAA9009316.1 serine/threonine protein phosphatase [Histidinibacterium aquaticum]
MRLLNRLLGREAPVFPPPEPEGRLQVVGDIHGRTDLLDSLLARLDLEAPLVFVGDYVDRGPDSAGVLRRLRELDRRGTVTCLTGNHEDMMLAALDDPEAARLWLRNGGLETLASFGLGAGVLGGGTEGRTKMARELREALGETEAWLRERPLWHRSGNVVVAHAGLDPKTSPEAQVDSDLLWGHPDFGRRHRVDGLWVVHGHVIVDGAHSVPGRVAVDTGAYATDRLTAAVIERGEVHFVST